MNVPEPGFVLKKLSSAIPVIYSALQHGTFKAKEYFDESGRNVDRYLAPNLVRYNAKEVLEKRRQEISSGDDLIVINVPNNGMYVSCGDFNIRILKTNNGDLPVPGHSKSRMLFYHQGSLALDFSNNKTISEQNDQVNLLILWDVVSPYNLGELSIACPKSGYLTRESVAAHWHCKIPDALLLGHSVDNIPIELLDVEDLPISLNREEQTGTEDIGD